MSDEGIKPDYRSTTVWSNDDQKNVSMLLEKHGGNVDKAVGSFFRAGSTTYKEARLLSARFGPAFGMTPTDFMKKYRAWRKGNL